MRTRILAAAGSTLLLATVITPAAAGDTTATFVVDAAGDAGDAAPGDGDCATVDGDCTLRAAADEANASADATRVRLAVDAVQLDAAIAVTGDLTVVGSGATVTAAPGDRVLDVVGGTLTVGDVTLVGAGEVTGNGGIIRATDADVTVADATLTGGTVVGAGASGGAIGATDSTLTVVGSTIADSTSVRAGGGIEAAGSDVLVRDSVLVGNDAGTAPGNGGGLHQGGVGTVRVVDSSVTGNTALEGGGLWVSAAGTMTVVDTDVSDNAANGDALGRGGGGLFNQGGTLTVTGSTVTGNTAPNGAGSGGGVLATGTTTIVATTISDNDANRAGGGVEATTLGGAPAGTTLLREVDLSDNVTGPAPGNGGGLHTTATNDVRVVDSVVDGNEAASEGGGLWNNAGSTMTVVQTVVTDNAALGTAADNGGGGLFNNGGVLVVTDSRVRGNTADQGSGSGGGILTIGELTVTGTTIDRNSAARAGGGIEATAVRAEDGTIAAPGSTLLRDVRLSRNVAGPTPGNGGALHVTFANDVRIVDSTVGFNTATREGGGLWNNAGSTMTVVDTNLARNVALGTAADDGGGALFNNGGVLVVRGGIIQGNTATEGSGSGGGAFNLGGELLVDGTFFNRNASNRAGGGIEAVEGRTILSSTNLKNNVTGAAPGNGGGLHLTGAGHVEITGGFVLGNTAANEGGGLWNSSTGTMVVTDARIRQNDAPVGPNVFTQPGGTFTIDGAPVAAGDNDLFEQGGSGRGR